MFDGRPHMCVRCRVHTIKVVRKCFNFQVINSYDNLTSSILLAGWRMVRRVRRPEQRRVSDWTSRRESESLVRGWASSWLTAFRVSVCTLRCRVLDIDSKDNSEFGCWQECHRVVNLFCPFRISSQWTAELENKSHDKLNGNNIIDMNSFQGWWRRRQQKILSFCLVKMVESFHSISCSPCWK